MHDADVRHAVLALLRLRHPDPAAVRIVEELGVWSGSARIDVAAIGTDLYGVEIKSASDTLKRLDWQVDLYGRVFDRVDLVAAERHLAPALARIPPWWGVLRAAEDLGGVRLEPVRVGGVNPSPDPALVSALLWRDEVLAILRERGLARGWASKAKPKLDAHLAASLSRGGLTEVVCATLRARAAWRDGRGVARPCAEEGSHAERWQVNSGSAFRAVGIPADDDLAGHLGDEDQAGSVGEHREVSTVGDPKRKGPTLAGRPSQR